MSFHVGAQCRSDGTVEFRLWAPAAGKAALHLLSPEDRLLPMAPEGRGYRQCRLQGPGPGTLYRFVLDDTDERPDPASQFQPQGVHGPSAVVNHAAWEWTDGGWICPPLAELVIYEIHVGTFTAEGTFVAIVERLPELIRLGINAIELMPVAQFPGERNWGYDGASPYAAQNTYGGPGGLKKLVDCCHGQGIAVILDVVYNHLGPEGNYLWGIGPYFTDKYRTPWGDAVNYDGPYSDEVRNYFVGNALHWLEHYHVDALRLDAVHGIYDFSAHHILEELSEAVNEWARRDGKPRYLIAETDRSDPLTVTPREQGGKGMDAQWADDFHHCVHTLLTGEKRGYYEDFGALGQLEKAFREPFVYSGEYSAYRKRSHGRSARGLPGERFVVCIQNHDQVGNRMAGERLGSLVSFEAAKLAAGTLLSAPYVPLLFMGEEYAEEAPFQYFVSHEDPELYRAVSEGRHKEFSSFGWEHNVPEPTDQQTFRRSKLRWDLRTQDGHRHMLAYYRRMLELRRNHPALRLPVRGPIETRCYEKEKVLMVTRWAEGLGVLCIFHYDDSPVVIRLPEGIASPVRLVDSTTEQWRGPGASLPEKPHPGQECTVPGYCCALYEIRGL